MGSSSFLEASSLVEIPSFIEEFIVATIKIIMELQSFSEITPSEDLLMFKLFEEVIINTPVIEL